MALTPLAQYEADLAELDRQDALDLARRLKDTQRAKKKAMKITDYMVQKNSHVEFEKGFLSQPMRAVNMRLFETSLPYRQLIFHCIHYLSWMMDQTFEDYSNGFGCSAANLGIPFSIIAYKEKGKVQICINPKITGHSKETIVTKTNCGSLKLAEQVEIWRYSSIDIEFYDLEGRRCVKNQITRTEGGLAIQHEIDHCLGILVTDECRRYVKPVDAPAVDESSPATPDPITVGPRRPFENPSIPVVTASRQAGETPTVIERPPPLPGTPEAAERAFQAGLAHLQRSAAEDNAIAAGFVGPFGYNPDDFSSGVE